MLMQKPHNIQLIFGVSLKAYSGDYSIQKK